MRPLFRAAALAAFALIPQLAAAQSDKQVLFKHKQWTVNLIAFEDGSISCQAEVGSAGEYFSIWADGASPVQLHFYSDVWSFDDETADIRIEIDRRGAWNLNNAELDGSSVFFGLGDGDGPTRLLREVMSGNVLYLRNAERETIRRYSLSGSSASMRKLIECVDLLTSRSGGRNPFN